jgi:hypothetical protein
MKEAAKRQGKLMIASSVRLRGKSNFSLSETA